MKSFKVTLTPCPHKKNYAGIRYKDLTHFGQRAEIAHFVRSYMPAFPTVEMTFELTKESNLIHAHLHLFVAFEWMLDVFRLEFITTFGYKNKTSIDEHYILIERCETELEYDNWIEYMYKEVRGSIHDKTLFVHYGSTLLY